MGKLQEMKQKVEETKKRLDSVSVFGEAENGAVKAEVTANRKVKSIQISESVMADKEQLEDLLVIALNRALEQADKINEFEMADAAKGLLPGM